MQLSNPSARFGLSTNVEASKSLSRVRGGIGFQDLTQPFEGADVAYGFSATLVTGEDIELDIATGVATASASATYPSAIAVSGTLTVDGVEPVVFPVMPFQQIDVNGKPKYGIGGYTCEWSNFYSRWVLRAEQPSIALWRSSSDVADPTLASGWLAESPATGTPVVTASGDPIVIGVADGEGDGTDFEGRPLPTMVAIKGIMVQVDQGAIEIEDAFDTFKVRLGGAPESPGRILIAGEYINGWAISPGNPVTFTAIASSGLTRFQVFVIGSTVP